MIKWKDYEQAVETRLGIDISKKKNKKQNQIIKSSGNESLFLVAGPGSGKTTAIVLRILKLIFVEGISPSSIIATTFTKKAAAELRSRILGWGDKLRQHFLSNQVSTRIESTLKKLNLNEIRTGTIDSISEEVMGEFRKPGSPPPAVIEEFATNILMISHGLFAQGRFRKGALTEYLAELQGTHFGLNTTGKASILRTLKDRLSHDQVNEKKYRRRSGKGARIVCNAIDDYREELRNRMLLDFAILEQNFLQRLRSGELDDFLNDIKFVLVDEYQDTNYLQEQIYFELAKAALKSGGSLTVVGDDDQSLYRFRGATVVLFRDFLKRVERQLSIKAKRIFLIKNYRSTKSIIDFYNEFIKLDEDFQEARVEEKPKIIPGRNDFTNYPVLGMFRPDIETLCQDLAELIHDVIHGGGYKFEHSGQNYSIKVEKKKGSPADIVVLCSSPREFSGGGQERLPLLLRRELREFNPPIEIFNPRGQEFPIIDSVQTLCGLVLECIDPRKNIQEEMENLPEEATSVFDNWRQRARRYIRANPSPHKPRNLKQFVRAWQVRKPLGTRRWRREVSLHSLIYNLITWIPSMLEEIEGLVYLEAISRTIDQAALVSPFGAELIFDNHNPNLGRASIRQVIWNIFVPIATGAVEIEEDLLETLPPDRLNIMSVHQAKGLEFPMVIVDIGSDFRRNHWRQAFRRYPRDGGMVCRIEDGLRRHSPLGEPTRSGRDRAFDDLFRHFYVAYSRPQDVLLLVGLLSSTENIKNVASGWSRDGEWHWKGLENIVHI